MLAKLRALALILAFIAAAVPSFMYITDANRDWLWIHIGINIFVYITVALTTIQTTLDVAGRDKHKLPVPTRFEHNPILAKWWTAVRLAWHWHALAAIARVGLAHALAQRLHTSWFDWVEYTGIVAPFHKYTHPLDGGEIFVRSQWITMLIGCCLLILFCIAESAILSAVTIMMQSLWKHRLKQAIGVLLARTVLIGAVIGGMLIGYKLCEPGLTTIRNPVYDYEFDKRLEQWSPILNMMHRIGFTLLDNGTMMAAEIMLPVGDNISFGCASHISVDFVYTCTDIDNLPHVLHQVVLGLGGLSLYAALAAFCLWLAQRRYRRQSSSVS